MASAQWASSPTAEAVDRLVQRLFGKDRLAWSSPASWG
jgi:hypothetical protein